MEKNHPKSPSPESPKPRTPFTLSYMAWHRFFPDTTPYDPNKVLWGTLAEANPSIYYDVYDSPEGGKRLGNGITGIPVSPADPRLTSLQLAEGAPANAKPRVTITGTILGVNTNQDQEIFVTVESGNGEQRTFQLNFTTESRRVLSLRAFVADSVSSTLDPESKPPAKLEGEKVSDILAALVPGSLLRVVGRPMVNYSTIAVEKYDVTPAGANPNSPRSPRRYRSSNES